MAKYKDLIGRQFGRLTVQSFAGCVQRPRTERKSSIIQWNCVCTCGVEKVIPAYKLLHGSVNSCGCLRRETSRKLTRKAPGYASMTFVFNGYKSGAKKRGYEWGLTRGQFGVLCKMDCQYCGKPPSNTRKGPDALEAVTYNGLDRRDNDRGYVLGNVVPCCAQCNRKKMAMHLSDFFRWISAVYNRSVKHTEYA